MMLNIIAEGKTMTKYSPVQVLLHWISAIVIIWAMTSGFYIFLGNTSEHVKEFVGFINVSVTTLFVPFFALRIYYAIKSGKPANIKRKPGNHALANAVHIIIYINTALVLFTGVMIMERDINIFNLVQLPHPLQGGALTSAFHQLHIISCVTLSILIVMHVLAVFFHHLAGNPILKKMSW